MLSTLSSTDMFLYLHMLQKQKHIRSISSVTVDSKYYAGAPFPSTITVSPQNYNYQVLIYKIKVSLKNILALLKL